MLVAQASRRWDKGRIRVDHAVSVVAPRLARGLTIDMKDLVDEIDQTAGPGNNPLDEVLTGLDGRPEQNDISNLWSPLRQEPRGRNGRPERRKNETVDHHQVAGRD